MPPTLLTMGFSRWGIVIARLIVDGEDHGFHPFLVQTSNQHTMCPGVTNVCLPLRGGTMLDYSMTIFNNVHLPPTAFLGTSLEKPKDSRTLLHSYIWRISVGTPTLGVIATNLCKLVACISTDYSFRRHVRGRETDKMPIISFRTQSLPVLNAVAIAHVLKAWIQRVVAFFTNKANSFDEWTSLGVVVKTTVCRLAVEVARGLGERLGSQGLFPQNLLGVLEVCQRIGFLGRSAELTVIDRPAWVCYRRRRHSRD